MSKAVVVSFFESNNLGDLALSNIIEKLINNKQYELVKYDFLTVNRVDNTSTEILFNKEINNFKNKKSELKSIKSKIKSFMNYIVGETNLSIIRYKVVKLLNRRKWIEIENSIKESDILVIGGGNMLMDINPTWPDLFEEYILLAKKHKKEIHVVYVGAGPIYSNRSKIIYNKSLGKANKISVRDKISKDICKSIINNKEIIQVVDPAFSIPIDLIEYRLNKINYIKKDGTYKIGISVLGEMCFSSQKDHEVYLENLSQLFNSIVSLGKEYVEFILFSTEIADYTAVNKFRKKIDFNKHNNITVINVNKVNDIIKLYENLDFLLGGRMHGLIFAQKCLLPFIGVVWQNKINGFGDATESNDRIYEVNDIKEKKNIIAEKIINDITDNKLIENMDLINKKLYDLVLKGIKI